MFQLYLFQFVLFEGTLAGPFRLGDVEPGYDQVAVRAAMAPDGRFAAAWIDSIGTSENYKLWIRFYDKDGNPLTDAQEIAKIVDTNWLFWPELGIDSLGRTILLWSEGPVKISDSTHIRFQRFDRDGKSLDAPKSLRVGHLPSSDRCVGLGCNLAGELAVVWETGEHIWIQRCDSSGNLLGDAFLAHDSFPEGYISYFRFPSVSLNDEGDIAVTWLEAIQTGNNFPRYQVFDKNNESILPWNGEGHLLDTFYTVPSGLGYDGTRLEVLWLDNQRFAVFWNAYWFEGYFINFMGKVLSDKGLTKPPRQVLMRDNRARFGGYYGWYSTEVCGERFVMGYDRAYSKTVDSLAWQHQAGFLGQVVDNEPQSTTAIFEVSPPLGKDTLQDSSPQPPAVACCDDRIVWVYSRLEPDTTWKAYFLVTDWDMSAIAEPPPSSPVTPVTHPVTHFNPVGREIILHYSDSPQGFHAAIYDASGRRVDEIYSTQTQGIIQWGAGRGPGVYFIVPQGSKVNSVKVILVH